MSTTDTTLRGLPADRLAQLSRAPGPGPARRPAFRMWKAAWGRSPFWLDGQYIALAMPASAGSSASHVTIYLILSLPFLSLRDRDTNWPLFTAQAARPEQPLLQITRPC